MIKGGVPKNSLLRTDLRAHITIYVIKSIYTIAWNGDKMIFKTNGRISEATIQAEIYHQLKTIGIECYLEQNFDIIYKGRPHKVRADIIIVKNYNIVCICEVKNGLDERPNKNTRQYHKYQILGIPFFYCMNVSQINNVISDITNLYIKI